MHAARPPANAILRPRLLQRLDAALEHPLTLVEGPAGSGKSTLLAQWRGRCPLPVAWLALHQRDRDPQRAFARLIAALEPLHPGLRATIAGAPLAGALTALVSSLAEAPQEVAVIIDQCHTLQGPALAGLAAPLLDYLPPNVHIVLAVRGEPPWPLPRLRVRGQLLEIGAGELAFTVGETAALLEATHAPAVAGRPTQVHAWAEGWATGVAWAASALRQGTGLSPLPPALARYFRAQVMQHLPPEVRAFLRRTAHLDPLTAPACNAVTGRTDSAEVLEHLRRANLFVTPLDAGRRAYRYHRLFAEFLREEA